ncbi:MAG: ECF transporter S component [Candidatus Bathyarchaeota archaeon]|nr:MAG: ECF transporter S component [Candidatus Bathyarchaeota archaeon]
MPFFRLRGMQTNSTKAKLIQISLWAIMAALVCAATLLIRIPNPMGGYFNVGDVMIFVSALTFGPVVGGIAGGIGSSLADLIGFPVFAVPTLIIKGLEGFLAGLISDRRSPFRDIIAVTVAGIEMIFGYFITEVYLWGIGAALLEIPGNIGQIAIGGVVGIPIAVILRRRLPEIIET